MRGKVLAALSLVMMLGGLVRAQQAAGVSSTQAAPGAGDLASTMKSLEDQLRSVGRVTWNQNILHRRQFNEADGKHYKLVVDRESFWEEITNVAADPGSCLLKVRWQTSEDPDSTVASGGPVSLSTYLEEVAYQEEVALTDVRSVEEFLHIYRHEPFNPEYQENVQPPLYSVAMITWGGVAEFKFRDKESAEVFGALLREAARECTASPLATASNNGPSLNETLGFIANKLSTQGVVPLNWSGDIPGWNLEGGPSRHAASINYFKVNPSAVKCTLSFDSVEGMPPQVRLSLKHIGKIEILPLKEYLTSSENADLYISTGTKERTRFRVVEASPSFVLKITSPGADSKALYFSDETLADRVAKAINHAAELCGAGAKPEPF